MNKDLEQVIDILAMAAEANEKKVEEQEQERILVLNDEINSLESEIDYSEVEDLNYEMEELKNYIDGDLEISKTKCAFLAKTLETYNTRFESLIQRVRKNGSPEDRAMLDTYFSDGQIDKDVLINSPLMLEIKKASDGMQISETELKKEEEENIKLETDKRNIIAEYATKKAEMLGKLDSKKVEEEAYKENAVFEKKKELVKLMTKEGKVSSKEVVEEIKNMVSNKKDASLIKSKMLELASITGYKVADGKVLVDQKEANDLEIDESQFVAFIEQQKENIANLDANGKSERKNDLKEKENLKEAIRKSNEKIENYNNLLEEYDVSKQEQKHNENMTKINNQIMYFNKQLEKYNDGSENSKIIYENIMKQKEELELQKQDELNSSIGYIFADTSNDKLKELLIASKEAEENRIKRFEKNIEIIDSKLEKNRYSNEPSKLICELKIKEAEVQVANIRKRKEFLAKCDINNVIDEFVDIYANSSKENETEKSKFSKRKVISEKKADNVLAQKIRNLISDIPNKFKGALKWILISIGVGSVVSLVAIPKLIEAYNSNKEEAEEKQDTSKEEKKSTIETSVDKEIKETEVSKGGFDIENSVICVGDNADEKFDLSKLMEQGKLSKSVEDSANGIYSDNVRSRDQIPEELSVLRVYKLSDEGYDLVSDIRNPKDMSKYVISVGTETADGMAVTGYISGSDLSEVMYSAENTNSITK